MSEPKLVKVNLPMMRGYHGTFSVVDFYHPGLAKELWKRVRSMGWELVGEVTEFNIAIAKLEMLEDRN